MSIILEDCPMCDSKEIEVAKKCRVSKCEPKFKYTQTFLSCKSCGFGFITPETSKKTLESRDKHEIKV